MARLAGESDFGAGTASRCDRGTVRRGGWYLDPETAQLGEGRLDKCNGPAFEGDSVAKQTRA